MKHSPWFSGSARIVARENRTKQGIPQILKDYCDQPKWPQLTNMGT